MAGKTPRSYLREQILLSLLRQLGPAVSLTNHELLQVLSERIGGWGAGRVGIQERQLRRYLELLRETGRIQVRYNRFGNTRGSCRTITVVETADRRSPAREAA